VRISSADLDAGHVLSGQLVLVVERPINQFAQPGHQQPLRRPLDHNGLVRKVQIALGQRHVLVQEVLVVGRDTSHALFEIFNLGLTNICLAR